MKERTKTAGATRLLWSLLLGLSLALGLLWAMTPHSAAEAQAANPGLTVDLPDDATWSQMVPDDTAPVAHTSADTPAPAPPPGERTPPDFAPPHDQRMPPDGQQIAGGAPLFAPAGARSRGAAPLTPPLPGNADLAVCMTSDRVWGVLGAGETATVTVDGAQMGAALADGIGFFWTTLYDGNGDCPNLSGGETVAIYSEGVQEASVTLRSISGQIDVVNDVVSGTIGGAGFPISVTIYAPWGEPSMTSYSQTVSTDGSGNFVADFTGIWDFDATEQATVAYVEGGVEVRRHVYPGESLLVRPWPWNQVMGYATPGTEVTATIYLSNTTEKDSTTLTADATDGWYRWNAETDFLVSDYVVVEFAGGTVMSRTVDTLSVNVDAANDRVTGEALSGATVRGLTGDLTPLGWRSVQATATADATGVYTLEFGAITDIMPDQWVGVYVADAEGDDLNMWGPAPGSVEVHQTWNEVYGRGPSPPGDLSEGWPVTLTLYSAASASESTYSKGMEWWGWYWFDEDDGLPDIAPGDVVTVESEGFAWQGVVEVKNMTVQHDLDADQFTGSVETPTERVELWGSQWTGWSQIRRLYPIAGSFDTLTTASSPFAATPAGFDVRNAVGYEVIHRTADDYTERIYREVDYLRVYPQYNGILALFGPPGTAYTITLRNSGGGFKAQLTGTSSEPIGEAGWNNFGWSGEQIETGDQVQAQSAAGFSQTVHIPAMTLQFDEANDSVSGSAPANSLLYVEVDDQGRGFVPTDGSGQFVLAVDQLQEFWGDGDLVWGNGTRVCYINEDANHVCRNFEWPQIIANYDMEGRSAVWGSGAIPGNTIYVTVTHPVSGVIATGTTTAGACDWCGPTDYRLDLADGTIVPGNTVTVNWGDGYVDSTVVVAITANPDVDTDVVTGTAPANDMLYINAEHSWGDWIDISGIQVDASGVYTIDFGTEGWDIQYGDRFNIHYNAGHGHDTQYSFWVPAPDLYINKWNVPGYARPGGVVVYGINYSNDGNGVAEDTLIVDTLPPNTTYAGDTSGFPHIEAGGVITWNLGNVEAGDGSGFIVTLDVPGTMPTGTGSIAQNCVAIMTISPGDDPGNNDYCADPVDVWDDEVDVGVDKWVNPDDPTPGQEFVYDIQPCNNRGAAAGPVWLTDTLPLSTTFVSWSSDFGDTTYWTEVVTTGGQLVLYALGLPGDTCEYLSLRLLLHPDAPVSTTLENTVVVATAGDVDPDNNERVNTNAHVSPPRYDMRLDKGFNSGVLVPGGRLDYHISYNNQGNVATHAWITDTLPPGTSYQPGSGREQDGGPPFPPATVTADYVVWDLGVVAVNEGFGLDFTLDISDTVAPGTVLTNCATVGIAEIEDTPEDNTACVTVTINPSGPNLRVTKSHEWRGNDDQLRYEIYAENIGTQRLENVWITDTCPFSTTFNWDWYVGHGPWITITHDAANHRLIFWAEEFDPGNTARIVFRVDLDNPGEPMRWYTNTVEITTPPDDANPDDNIYEDVAFSGGEVNWVDLDVYGTYIEGEVHDGPITITTAYTQTVLPWGGHFDWWFDDPFQPGDTVIVEAGTGTCPVVIHIPDPFDATADSNTDEVWGQIDALDHKWVTVDLDDGPKQDVQTDDSGNFSATFLDVPRGGQGEVRYRTEIDYADVTFHRSFQTLDLIVTVDYEHNWVNGNYEAGHTVWLTVTESDGFTVKATAVVSPTPGDGWSTEWWHWLPSQPDIEPGDWVYGLVNSGSYTTTVHVGAINGETDVDADTVSGTIDAPWLAPDLVTVRCEIHEENGPDGIQVYNVDPDGGSFFCDFGGTWDIRPEHNVAVNYTEPDDDRVQTHIYVPTPYLRISKEANGNPGAGGNFAFQIQYRNDGNGPAENTVITDTMQGMTYITDTSGFLHTGGGSGPIVWNLGTLPAHSWGQFDVFVEVTAVASDTIINTAQIATSTPYDQGGPEEKESEWSGHVEANDTHLNVGKGAWTHDPAPGTDFVFNVNVCNNGSTNSSEVTLTDTLHPSMTLQSWWGQHPGWTEVLSTSDQLVVTYPSIQPYGWCSGVYLRVHLDGSAWPGMYITNTAVISASNDLEDDDNEAFWEGEVGEPHTNLNVNKWWNWGQLVPGGELRYNINYGNNGNVPVVTTIRITDTLPVSTTFNRAWHWTPHGDQPFTPTQVTADYVTWDIGTLDNGYGGDLEIALDVDSNALPGTILTNTVEISPQPNEDSYDDNVSTVVETLYDHGPNLRVRKRGGWHGYGEGHNAWYNIVVENVGDERVDHVTLTDTYPISMSLDGDPWLHWPAVEAYTDNYTDSQFIITFWEMTPGWRMDFGFNTQIPGPDPVPFGLVFTNTAEVTLDPADANPDDNFDEIILTTGPDLYVEKTLVAGDLLPGKIITFCLTFGNEHEGHEGWWNMQGNAKLEDVLPDGLEYVASTLHWCDPIGLPGEWCDLPPDFQVGQNLFWNLWSIGAGNWNEIYLAARIADTAEGDDVFTNWVEITSDRPGDDVEPYYDNNEDTYNVAIALPKFEVGKVYESSRVAGMPVTYTLTVTNTGTEAGTNVVLSDTLPAGLTYGGSDGTLAGGDVTWAFANIAANGGTVTGWFSGTLPCTLDTITNDDYRVVSSGEGVDSLLGTPIVFGVIAPALDAAFDVSTDTIMVNTTVYFTDTSTTDGTLIEEREWDFGDGSAHVFTQNASHTYVSDGAFTVRLTVTDTCGYSDVQTATVTVNAPDLVADFDYAPDPAYILTDDTVIFTDTSTTNGPSIVDWLWDFGDGETDDIQNTSHEYTTVGTYTVGLVVTDALGYSDDEIKTNIVVVSPRCTELTNVTFTYAPSSPVIQSPVTFTATYAPLDATQPIIYAWDFGDGGSGSGQVVNHTYALSDTYTVVVTATNCAGVAVVTHSEDVTVILAEGDQTTVDPATGGTLVYTDTQGNPTTVEVPGGAVSESVTLLYTPVSSLTQPISPNLCFAGHAFDLDAYKGGTLQSGFVFSKPVTITIHYSDDDVQGISESSLYLYYWTGAVWEDAACGPYDRHPDENWLAVPICHLSRYGILGTSTHNIYLPLVMRNY